MHSTLVPSHFKSTPFHYRISYHKVLEDGIAEALGPNTPASDDALSPSLAVEHAEPGTERDSTEVSALDDPVLILGVSWGGEDERMLYYYAGQVGKTPCPQYQNVTFRDRRGGMDPVRTD